MKLLTKIFGTQHDRVMKSLRPEVNRINELEAKMQKLSDEELKGQTPLFRERVDKGEDLDKILPEAFATCREAATRVLGMRHYDVQMIGGMIMHRGNIAEMRTGEGKTLVATLPIYLNGLTGKGAHLVTVNDYLASRDAEWMSQVYNFLGLSVGTITHNLSDKERKASYGADITYGTNNEFGFDYLRDNMKFDPENFVQRPLNFAIVDECDSILIDEARTPLIISGAAEDDVSIYKEIDKIVPHLKLDVHFTLEEKSKTVSITEDGNTQVEKFLGVENVYDIQHIGKLHYIYQALKAHHLFKRDVDYMVVENEVIIIDEFTGRLMEGRRWSDGLHQAVEAKEGVSVRQENQTLATITFQNYFRMYNKLSGMTGTAMTEAGEFWEIYKLDVMEIPTNKHISRDDKQDKVFKTKREKYNAIIDEVAQLSAKGRPILIGTTSVEISELLSRMLKLRAVPHNVLNAKLHKREADIVAEAGKGGIVTIATNMAGRGTDIKLSKDVKGAGGLAIIGTERHDSRRVDRQLRGRAGRQGDPGSSQFYVSLEDNLMRLFGSEKIAKLMDRMGLEEGEVIQHSMISKSIERAQKKVEENNFGIRKRLLEYDDVMNAQREVIYKRRYNALYGERLRIDIANMIFDTSEVITDSNNAATDFENFEFELIRFFSMNSPVSKAEFEKQAVQKTAGIVYKQAYENYKAKMINNAEEAFPVIKQVFEKRGEKFERIAVPFTDGQKTLQVVTNLKRAYETEGKDLITDFEKNISLAIIDEAWKNHLRKMDELKQSVQLAVHEQKDPLLIYKFEAFELFKVMIEEVNKEVISFLFKGELPQREPDQITEARQIKSKEQLQTQKEEIQNLDERAAQSRKAGAQASQQQQVVETIVREQPKIGRNDKVTIKHVGSGEEKSMKYKQAIPLIDKGEWVLMNH